MTEPNDGDMFIDTRGIVVRFTEDENLLSPCNRCAYKNPDKCACLNGQGQFLDVDCGVHGYFEEVKDDGNT